MDASDEPTHADTYHRHKMFNIIISLQNVPGPSPRYSTYT